MIAMPPIVHRAVTGFAQAVAVLHENVCFAAFGAIQP
jgi:hypothetical protein